MQSEPDYLSPAELLADDAFLDHQLAPTPASTRYWADWLRTNPARQPIYDQAVALLAAIQLGLASYADTKLSDEAIHRLLIRIRQTNARHDRPLRVLRWGRWAAAAVFVLVLGAGIWWQQTSVTTGPVGAAPTAGCAMTLRLAGSCARFT